jgi:transcriptional regulator with XRE-family HTH domain
MENKTNINKILGERLLQLRGDKSLREIAANVGISYQALNFYENSKRDPSVWVAKKLADYYKVSVDYLIGTSDKR